MNSHNDEKIWARIYTWIKLFLRLYKVLLNHKNTCFWILFLSGPTLELQTNEINWLNHCPQVLLSSIKRITPFTGIQKKSSYMFGQFNIYLQVTAFLEQQTKKIYIFTFKIKLTKNTHELGDSYLITRAYSKNYVLECN